MQYYTIHIYIDLSVTKQMLFFCVFFYIYIFFK